MAYNNKSCRLANVHILKFKIHLYGVKKGTYLYKIYLTRPGAGEEREIMST